MTFICTAGSFPDMLDMTPNYPDERDAFVTRPGMRKLYDARATLGATATVQLEKHTGAIEALLAATDVVLRLDPSGVFETWSVTRLRAAVDELRVAIENMPVISERNRQHQLRRLIHAAKIVIRRWASRSASPVADSSKMAATRLDPSTKSGVTVSGGAVDCA